MADTIIGAMTYGELGPQFWLLAKLYTVSSIGIPAVADWLDAQADKATAQTQIDIGSSAVSKILSKSDAVALKEISKGKNQIDKACGS